jgi:methionyl-tRNA synthetase
MCGYDVAFLTGTDEHGEKIERAAAAAGQTPRQFVAEKRKLFVQLWNRLGMKVSEYPYPDLEPDSLQLRFIPTTHLDHEKSVRGMLLRAKENGYITKRQYEGRYCVSDERYISDGSEPANCDICGRPAELISEENYFFKLREFRKKLLNLYSERPWFVQPDYRMNEVRRFVEGDLRDISVSRKRIKWGIPFPLDEERDDPEQVVYVWYDALTSYMTGIGYAQGPLPSSTGRSPVPSGTGQVETGNEEFQKYWRNKPGESELVHMIGKDILRFHAVYWPSFIMAAYPDQPEMLPTTVFAHGWIYYEQDKMSKSKGNVVYPEPIVDALDYFGAPGNDALRYYLLREAPFGQDTSFSYEGLIQRYNAELANGLGNLATRTIAMLNQYFGGRVPERPATVSGPEEELKTCFFGRPESANVAGEIGQIEASYIDQFNKLRLGRPAATIWVLISEVNRYLDKRRPWELAHSIDLENLETLALVLYVAADALRTMAVLLHPILPETAKRLWEQLGCDGEVKEQRIDQLKWGGLKPGTKVGKPEPIFPRLDKAKTLDKLDELAEADRERDKAVGALREAPLPANLSKPKEAFIPVQTDKKPEGTPEGRIPSPRSPAPSPQPLAPGVISIEDFAKVDMRVGEVKAAEHVPGASKLLKLMVDIGTEVRQLVAGLAEYYRPENLVGMKVVVVTNLQPRKLRGVESNGMIVAATVGAQGRPVLVTFKEDVENGARLR